MEIHGTMCTEYIETTHAQMDKLIERISTNPVLGDIHAANKVTFAEVLNKSGVACEELTRQRAKIMLYIMLFGENEGHFAERVCEAYQLSEKYHC